MEREQVAQLLEKYWQVETTVEEERALAEYFRGEDLPLEWEPYREIFSFYEQEREIKPGDALEKRIMERVRPGLRWHRLWWAAAAVILALLVMEPLLRAPVKTMQGQRGLTKDTYHDPAQAMAAVEQALLIASKNMNKGLHAVK